MTQTPEDKTEIRPCNKCKEPTLNYVTNVVEFCTCKKCQHAYYCYMFLKEQKKSTFKKKDKLFEIANYQLKHCSEAFTDKYQIDWRDYLHKVWSSFESELTSGLNEAMQIFSLATESKNKGFSKIETEQAF